MMSGVLFHPLHVIFGDRQGLLLNLERIHLAQPADQQAQRSSSLCRPSAGITSKHLPHLAFFMWALGDQIPVPMLAQQALCQMNCVPRPHTHPLPSWPPLPLPKREGQFTPNCPFAISKADLSSEPQACISSCLLRSFSPQATRPLRITCLLLTSPSSWSREFPHFITGLRVTPDASSPRSHLHCQVLF